MLITNHVLAGALVGSLARDEKTAGALGLLSHFALDALPHWGARSHRHFLATAVVDGLIGGTAMAVIAAKAPKERRGRVVAGMVGATAPDANKPSQLFFGRSPFPRWVDAAHGAIQIESPEKLHQELVIAAILAPLTAAALNPRVQVSRARRRSTATTARAQAPGRTNEHRR